MEIIELEETASTNSYLAAIARESREGLTVVCRCQTAGRGQRGNSWESEPGKNITMSLLLKPAGLHPSRQFLVSQAVSVAIVSVLSRHLPGEEIRIKWPNDIYAGDRKICGILIENSITQSGINHCIVGMGINVNQTRFLSDAPTPVSMAMLTGLSYQLRRLTEETVSEILRETGAIATASEDLQKRYFELLWRREGYWPYTDNLRGERIMARIESVAPDGIITLALRDGDEKRSFAFKEMAACLK
ncbi:MAG: biotin--[acetyl-CoA-carboxylase] ligase [Duncaniella sp.]|nr:biotin--[acetyl-CoA-carboxylase] ligase [Duncaniella sp.]